MGIFEKTIKVVEDDLDDLKHVNNVRYVQWMQDIAKEHWLTKAPKDLINSTVWVVLTHHITYKSSAKLDDIILMKTYIDKTKGPVSVRVVEMYNKESNQLLVRSKTEWCLLNSETFKPMRISPEIESIFISQT
ncbi:thioesterase [Arenibacter sp. TNZ]|jgi:acyl-CoA thioester hydrolase|uniref:acyl-CoA thioesterase n=1 Tax=Arenibacter TaxID=178469 RepID=UPI000CD420D2|nr:MULTISPECIES: acyl-ACP thioesterase domain-containing protein [Arenibacter]MCM4172970.1 thioesterase [Arenibacter sp. TNZ]